MVATSRIRRLFRRRLARAHDESRCYPRLENLEGRDLFSVGNVFGQLPMGFEINEGQTDGQVAFLAHGTGYNLFLTSQSAVLDLHPGTNSGDVLALRLLNANSMPQIVGLDRQAGTSSYLIGNDPRQWHTSIPMYARVAYLNVYPSIDLVFYGNQQQLEYDFILHPGADPNSIHVAIDGAQSLQTDAQGDLVIHASGGDVVEHAPVIYQDILGSRRPVVGQYALEDGDRVGFHLGSYDRSHTVTIDPLLVYSTYLSGNGADSGNGIAVDNAGSAYVVGSTSSTNFPTTTGAFQTTLGGVQDAFVAKLNATGTGLVYSTYLGGSANDVGNGIAVDGSGSAYVVGTTFSSNFPFTMGAFQAGLRGNNNAFVTKLNTSGTGLLYSTYLGGTLGDLGTGIALDGSGNAYVVGSASSMSFPTTGGAFQTTLRGTNNAYITKLNASGSALLFSTFVGGMGIDNGTAIAVNSAGEAYITGLTNSSNFPTTPSAFQTTLHGAQSAFVTKVSANGSSLVYSSFFGGNAIDRGNGIALDSAGNAYITGATSSAMFPTSIGAFQPTLAGMTNAFVSVLSSGGNRLVYSTFLGGANMDSGNAIAVDASGSAYITGGTSSMNFPLTVSTTLQANLQGMQNAFLAKFNSTGTMLTFSTYLGGTGTDAGNGIAIDGSGNAYLTGSTTSPNFPRSTGAFQSTLGGTQGGFVSKILTAGPQTQTTLTPVPTTKQGRAITLTANVTTVPPGITPTGGTVTFFDGSTQLSLPVAVNNGVATLSVSTLGLGRHSITARFSGSGGLLASTSNPINLSIHNAAFFAVGTSNGHVLIRRTTDGSQVYDFVPYRGFNNLVNVAMGDVTGDGFDDLVTGAGAGNPDVKVYDGAAIANGTFQPGNAEASRLADWFPYGLNFNVGANVAVGDVSNDGFADIITGATVGNPDVRLYNGRDIANHSFNPTGTSLIAMWFPYALQFNVGANVAIGDINGDGFAEVVTGATAGNPHVKVYNGAAFTNGSFNPSNADASTLTQFFPFALQFNVGVHVAVGDINGDGFGDLIAGSSIGNPDVKTYDGQAISNGTFNSSNAETHRLGEFFPYALSQNIGVTVGASDFESNGRFDILTGSTNGPPIFGVFHGTSTGVMPQAVFESTLTGFPSGIAVGA